MAGSDADDLRAKEPHASDIESLALHIHRAHVDRAIESKPRSRCGRGDAMLARSGFRDDAGFSHAAGEEDLANRVVDLVRTSVEQVLALEINFRAAEFLGEPLGKVEWRGSAAKITQQRCQFLAELRILARRNVFALEILQSGHERFGNEHSAVGTEVSAGVGKGGRGACAHALNVAGLPRQCNQRAFGIRPVSLRASEHIEISFL